MQDAENRRFEAWLDDERRIVSFHPVPGGRYFSAAEAEFWPRIVELVLCGYRVQ